MGVVIYDKRLTSYIPPQECGTCSHFPDSFNARIGDAVPCVEVGYFVHKKGKACLKWTDEVIDG
jgi:hypothetical protein